jgi:hypothetical protein
MTAAPPSRLATEQEIAALLTDFAHLRRHTARAAAAVLPGPLLRAFGLGIPLLGLRPPCLGDFALLAGWGHPLADFVEAWMAGEPMSIPSMTQVQLDQVSCLWRTDWEKARQAATERGVDAFRGQSLEWLLNADLACAHALSAFSTGVRMRSGEKDGTVVVSGPAENGLGWWLCLFGFAVDVLGMPEDVALGYPLARLIARRVFRDRALHGMEFEGRSYVQQEDDLRCAADVPPACDN